MTLQRRTMYQLRRKVAHAASRDVVTDLQTSNLCKETSELIIVCKDTMAICDGPIDQAKLGLADLLSKAKEAAKAVTINSILPDATGTNGERIHEINNYSKDTCDQLGTTYYVDNDQNFLFRDGSCDGSVFRDNVGLLSSYGATRLMNNLSLVANADVRRREKADKRPTRALGAILQLKSNKKQSSQTAQWRAAAPDT